VVFDITRKRTETIKTVGDKTKPHCGDSDVDLLACKSGVGSVAGPGASCGAVQEESKLGSSSRRTTTDNAGGDAKNKDSSSGKDGNRETTRRTATRKPLTLETYDGSTPLETFLAKFCNCAGYNQWTVDEKVVLLRDSLTGSASQILCEIPDDTGDDEIVRLLQNRFTNSNLMEKYKAELKNRHRRLGKSVQAVYQDIKRLMALGLPAQSRELYEILCRDSFLDALGNTLLRIRVLDQQPKTLDETLCVVTLMEAYSSQTVSGNDDDGRKCVPAMAAQSNNDSETDKRIQRLEGMLREQKDEIDRLRAQSGRRQSSLRFAGQPAGDTRSGMRSGDGPPGPASFPPTCWQPQAVTGTAGTACDAGVRYQPQPASGPFGTAAAVNTRWQYQPMTGAVPMAPAAHMQAASPQGGAYYSAPSNAPGPQAVFNQIGELAGGATGTGGPNHAAFVPSGQMAYQDSGFNYNGFGNNNYSFRRQRRLRGKVPRDVYTRCLQKRHWPAQCLVAGARAEIGAPETNFVQNVAPSSKRSETYINIMIKGCHAQALLDTGCERSVCLLRLRRNAKLTPVNTELFAANNTPISMLSTTRLIFEVQGMTLFADVFVSESNDEFILGP